MANPPIFRSSISNVPNNFQFVPFVLALSEANNSHEKSSSENMSRRNLSGDEASRFYKEVISSPPICSSSLRHTKKQETIPKKRYSYPSNTKSNIFHCAQEGNIEGIEYFLSKKCNVDVQDMYGWTPLMCATFEGHYAVAECLIKNGAKLDIKNKQGLSSLDIALSKNHKALIKLFINGTTNKTEISVREMKKERKFCNLCKCSYEESTSVHEKSIAHLFSSKSTNNISTYYHIPENNKGFQIMLKKGWDKNCGLGVNASGRKFPVKTILKTNRTCIGGSKEIPKITHFGPNDYQSVKVHNQPIPKLKRDTKFKKYKMKKLDNRNRQLEIEFRRQFHLE